MHLLVVLLPLLLPFLARSRLHVHRRHQQHRGGALLHTLTCPQRRARRPSPAMAVFSAPLRFLASLNIRPKPSSCTVSRVVSAVIRGCLERQERQEKVSATRQRVTTRIFTVCHEMQCFVLRRQTLTRPCCQAHNLDYWHLSLLGSPWRQGLFLRRLCCNQTAEVPAAWRNWLHEKRVRNQNQRAVQPHDRPVFGSSRNPSCRIQAWRSPQSPGSLSTSSGLLFAAIINSQTASASSVGPNASQRSTCIRGRPGTGSAQISKAFFLGASLLVCESDPDFRQPIFSNCGSLLHVGRCYLQKTVQPSSSDMISHSPVTNLRQHAFVSANGREENRARCLTKLAFGWLQLPVPAYGRQGETKRLLLL